MSDASHHVERVEDLERLFGAVGEASLRKEVATLHPIYRAWIEKSPFAVLATTGPDGLDASPRGDPAPLVRIRDDRTILLPERRGNNRIDSLRNIVHDPRVALLFFVPGVRETLRVNGTARICIEPQLLSTFPMQGQLPNCVVEVAVQAVYFQCGRALLRSALWSGDHASRNAEVPTAGAMLDALTRGAIDGGAYDDDLPQRQAGSLY